MKELIALKVKFHYANHWVDSAFWNIGATTWPYISLVLGSSP